MAVDTTPVWSARSKSRASDYPLRFLTTFRPFTKASGQAGVGIFERRSLAALTAATLHPPIAGSGQGGSWRLRRSNSTTIGNESQGLIWGYARLPVLQAVSHRAETRILGYRLVASGCFIEHVGGDHEVEGPWLCGRRCVAAGFSILT